MRKGIALLILPVFLFNIGGYYLWFSAIQYKVQKEVRQQIKKGLKDEDLTLIIVPAIDESALCWVKPNKEFRYRGEMYDVVKFQDQHQKKYYYCLNDKKEKQLIANFNKNHNTKKEAGKRIKRALNYTFDLQRCSIVKIQLSEDITFTSINAFYKSGAIEIHSPPPKSI